MAPPAVAELPHHALEQMGGLGVQTHKGFIHDDELRGWWSQAEMMASFCFMPWE